jgi:hypothetical protein
MINMASLKFVLTLSVATINLYAVNASHQLIRVMK